MKRIALKFAYDGLPFYGYARQPNLETVEGTIIRALEKNKFISDVRSACFQSASRTDKGVSALGNVASFNTEVLPKTLVKRLSEELTNIYVYGSTVVDDDFYPRHANVRRYRYFLPKKRIKRETMKKTLSLFQGTHDFSNFARIESHKNPVRLIEMVSVDEHDKFYTIDISAHTFLWQQIRRMISAMIRLEKNKITKNDIIQALNHPEQSFDFGVAPPEPLILVDVKYQKVEFDVNKNIEKMKKEIENRIKTRVKDLVF